MNLTEYVRILWRRGWIMLLLAVIVGGTAYVLSRQQTPVYRATQLVLIQPSRTDFGLTQASSLLLNPSVVFLDSRQIAEQIIEEQRLDMTPDALKGSVTIAPDQLRLTVQIDVQSTDGELANQIARAWGQKLVDYRNEQNQLARREDRVNAIMPDTPTYSQISPRPRLTALAGAILGLGIGGVIVFVLEFLESGIVRRKEDLERGLNLPVLATIPGLEGR